MTRGLGSDVVSDGFRCPRDDKGEIRKCRFLVAALLGMTRGLGSDENKDRDSPEMEQNLARKRTIPVLGVSLSIGRNYTNDAMFMQRKTI